MELLFQLWLDRANIHMAPACVFPMHRKNRCRGCVFSIAKHGAVVRVRG